MGRFIKGLFVKDASRPTERRKEESRKRRRIIEKGRERKTLGKKINAE